jgi:hypothetical protein
MFGFKTDNAVDFRKERIVLADANVDAGMEMRPALTDQNVARKHELTVRALRPEPLGLAVAAVREEPSPFLCANSCRFFLNFRYTSCVDFKVCEPLMTEARTLHRLKQMLSLFHLLPAVSPARDQVIPSVSSIETASSTPCFYDDLNESQ